MQTNVTSVASPRMGPTHFTPAPVGIIEASSTLAQETKKIALSLVCSNNTIQIIHL